ncbi:SagB family peptide dehydrogenase [Metabacillus sp. KIGAM252]|uniref:SagB family peptide dehydrogenase n=1 Tax=Metabacillus flavus TaxID=2823519 RepID=A0ABS5LAX7_9BACI|nr:SagB family peptide dehydrogenase [Metabacillus flavus]MBS2967886.1 SagB family peptide dehydrogenase [Metabacillus flavus]
MNLEKFLYTIHFDMDQASPPDWQPDWEDAPLPYKVYRELPVIQLEADVPLSLAAPEPPCSPGLKRLGHFLWYTYGLAQISHTVYPEEESDELSQSLRRFAPSGGGLYPNELYVYLKLEDIPAGVYHYDVARHGLVLLREGNADVYLSKALGNRCDVSSCFGTVLISARFWKNFFKYNQFSYRLQGLDAGAVTGQLLEMAKRFGYASGVYFQFLDRAVNHLLGLDQQQESVYAVIPLSVEPTRWSATGNGESETAEEVCRMIPGIETSHYVGSKRILEFPVLNAINEASFLESGGSFRKIRLSEKTERGEQEIPLPGTRLSYDLALACKNRFSPEMDFTLGKVTSQQAGNLLREAFAAYSYRNDLDGAGENRPRVSIYACFYKVEGTADGAYRYDEEKQVLKVIRSGDHRFYLQDAMTLNNLNLYQIPMVIHVAGARNHLLPELGYRGYRIQQMEAGMLTQRLLLTAAAIGWGGHPLLGFEGSRVDELYGLDERGETCLIQIPIGPYRERASLKGSLKM